MIGIRREDRSEWESRVPLVPEDVGRLISEHGIEFRVQSSPIRVIKEEAYQAVGATIVADMDDCPIVMGVKEIPPKLLQAGRTYVYFAHVIKGQAANMPALRRLLELGCNLIDYELITDDQGRRLVFFGRYAGLAGMIDTLWALGQRLQQEGIENPFARLQLAHQCGGLEECKRAVAAVGEEIRARGLPEAIRPLICGFAGYGQVSRGAQEIYDLLPVEEIGPEELASVPASAATCYKVVFQEQHMVEPVNGTAPFELQEYYQHPERYRAVLLRHMPHLALLVNCIYWEPKYPRMLTREHFQELYGEGQPRLRVVGDITCDVDGSLECTTRATDPGSPVYVYDPATGETRDGVAGHGPVVLAVDFLPCELPLDSSRHFSRTLSPLIPGLARADFAAPLAASGLPAELVRGTIVYQGELTEPYRHLERYLVR